MQRPHSKMQPPLTDAQAARILCGGTDATRRRLRRLVDQVQQTPTTAKWRTVENNDTLTCAAAADLVVPCRRGDFELRYGVPFGVFVDLCNRELPPDYVARPGDARWPDVDEVLLRVEHYSRPIRPC